MKDEPLVKVRLHSSGWLLVGGAVVTLAVVTLFCFTYYQNALLEERAPIVQTCVQHRVTQKVMVVR